MDMDTGHRHLAADRPSPSPANTKQEADTPPARPSGAPDAGRAEASASPAELEYASWLITAQQQPAAAPRSPADAPERPAPDATPATLYERLGRREGIARITRSLIDNHMANPLVSLRYAASDMVRVEQNVVDFFCAGAGGPQTYGGKDMRATHRGMNISEQEFMAVVDDAMAALESNGIDLATRNDVLAILWSLRREVVRV
jgi:hemoglobin